MDKGPAFGPAPPRCNQRGDMHEEFLCFDRKRQFKTAKPGCAIGVGFGCLILEPVGHFPGKPQKAMGSLSVPLLCKPLIYHACWIPPLGTKVFFRAKYFNGLERDFVPPRNPGYHHLLGNSISWWLKPAVTPRQFHKASRLLASPRFAYSSSRPAGYHCGVFFV